jgi:translocation and assembly module TamB
VEDTTQPPAPPPRGRRRRPWIIAGLAVVPILAIAALLGWLFATEGGTVALARAAGPLTAGQLQIEVASGRLLGPLHLSLFRYTSPTLHIAVRDLALDWQPAALLQRRVEAASLTASSVEVATAPTGEPLRAPESLALPVAVSVARLAIDDLLVARIAKEEPEPLVRLTAIAAQLDSDGRQHRIKGLRLESEFGNLEGDLALDGAKPFALQSGLRLRGSREGKDYAVRAETRGTLEAVEARVDAEVLEKHATAAISLTPFAAVPFTQVRISAHDIDPALFHPSAPKGQLSADVDLRPLAGKELALGGTIRLSNSAPGPADRQQIPLKTAEARLAWQADDLSIDAIAMEFPGRGSARGAATWKKGLLNAQLTLNDVDAREIASALKPTRLSGSIEATSQGEEQSILADLRDPRFSLKADAVRRGQNAEVRTARLEAKRARFDAAGKLALDGKQAFEVRGSLAQFDPSLFADVPRANLNADLSARGQLKPKPVVDGQFSLKDCQFDGKPLAGRGSLQLMEDRLAAADIALDLAGNRATAQGAFGRPGDRLNVVVGAPRLGALGHGLGGSIKASATLSGTFAQPSGRIEADAANLTLPGDQALASLAARGELREGLDGPANLHLELADYRAAAQTRVHKAALDLRGTRRKHDLDVHGTLAAGRELSLKVSGGLQPGPAWRGQLASLEVTGSPPLHLVAPVALEAGPQRVALGPTELRSDTALARIVRLVWTPQSIDTEGNITGLPLGVGVDEQGHMRAHSDGLRLGASWKLRLADHADGLVRVFRESGDLVLEGDSRVKLGLSRLEAVVNANRDRVAWSLDAAGSRLGQISGAGTALVQRAGGWRLVPAAAVAGAVRAEIPSISWLGPWLDPDLNLDGAVRAQFDITGTGARPRGRGTILGDKLAAASVEFGTRFSNGELRLTFDDERVRLEKLAFATVQRTPPREGRIDTAGLVDRPGKLSASGELELASAKGNLRVEADRVLLAQRPDRWLMLSGSGNLASAGKAGATLEAKVQVDAGYWELARLPPPSLSDDVIVKGRQAADGQHRVPLSLDVAVSMGRQFYFRGRGLDTRLMGDLRVRKEGQGPLRAVGSITTREGTFDAYGRKLTIQRGIVNFQGPLDNPGLNVLALRKGLAVEAGVAVSGPVVNPQVKLVSEPAVPDAEKLSWIVLGHGPEQAAGADSALLLSAANSILGGQEGGISRQLAQTLGVDDIGIASGQLGGGESRLPTRTVAGSLSSGNSGTVSQEIFTVGKQLSANTRLSFERSLAGAETIVKITYALTRRFSLTGRAGADNAVDIFYSYAFK